MNKIMRQALKQHQRKVKDLKKLSLIDKTVQRQGLLIKMKTSRFFTLNLWKEIMITRLSKIKMQKQS